VEEPVFDTAEPHLKMRVCERTQVRVVTPHLASEQERNQVLERLIADFILAEAIKEPIIWFYTPMAVEFLPKEIKPAAVVYDCMDELSMFRGAPSQLQILEKYLLKKADLVFTGGVSLFELSAGSIPRCIHFRAVWTWITLRRPGSSPETSPNWAP